MGLIKAAEVDAPAASAASRVVRVELRDFEAEARAMLDAARREASGIVAAAETMRERSRAEGYEAGRAAGWREGLERGSDIARDEAMQRCEQELTLLLNALTAATASLQAAREQVESAALADAVQLAIAIAERITRRRGMIDPNVLLENVRAAMQLVARGAASIRIAIHPSQGALLGEILAKLRVEWPQLGAAEIVQDPQIQPGGCRVHTARGRVDADLKSQLERIAVKLLPQPQAGADETTGTTGMPGDGGGP